MGKNKHKEFPKNTKVMATIDPINEGVENLVVGGLSTHSNLNQRLVYLYENTIRICLMKNIQKLEDHRAWQTPLGILLTIVITFLTTDFKNWLFSKDTWQAIFLILGGMNFIWLIRTLFVMPKQVTVDEIINELIPAGTEIKKDKISKY